MAKKYSGGTVLGTGFKLNDPQPIADYMVVELIADLDTLPNQFNGMLVFVEEDEKYYSKKEDGWEILNGDTPTLQSVLNAGHVSMGTPLTIRSANDANSKGSIQLTSQGVRLGGEAGGITLSGETGGVNILGGSTGVEINSLGTIVHMKESSPTNGSLEIYGNGSTNIIFNKNNESKIDLSAPGGVNIDALSNSINITSPSGVNINGSSGVNINGDGGLNLNTYGVANITAPGHAKVNSKNIVTSVNGVEANYIGELTLDIPESNFSTLTTAGTSGESTLSDGNLNIPRYDLDMGLVRTVEEGKTGWAMRVHTLDPKYDNIGSDAIELMASVTTSGKGATGDYSTIVGGYNHLASGIGSTIIGGTTNRATGQESVVIGGGNNWAVGQYSFSSGGSNRSFAYGEVTMGVNGTVETGGTALSPVATDRIFNIGNGTLTPTNVKSNAFTIRRNGLATLPSVTNALITADATGKAIITKEYLSANAVTPTQLTNGLSGKADDSEVVKITGDQDIDGLKKVIGTLRVPHATDQNDAVPLGQLNDAISGVADNFIPLSGTEVEKPITGDLEISSENKIFTESGSNESGIKYFNDGAITNVRLYSKNATDEFTGIEISNDGIYVQDDKSGSKGIVGGRLFDKQNDPYAFAQMEDITNALAVDNYIPLSGTEELKPITGPLMFAPRSDTETGIGMFSETNQQGIFFNDDESFVAIVNGTNNVILTPNELLVNIDSEESKGVVGNHLFDKQNDPLAFAQLGDVTGESVSFETYDDLTAKFPVNYFENNSTGIETFTLPVIEGNESKLIYFVNKSDELCTLTSNGLDEIWYKDVLLSIEINPKGSVILKNNGSYWVVLSIDNTISGYIPLSGTEVEKPITGDLEIQAEGNIHKIYQGDRGLEFDDDNGWIRLSNDMESNSSEVLVDIGASSMRGARSILSVNDAGIIVNSTNPASKGIYAPNTLFNKQNDPNAFAQLGDVQGTNTFTTADTAILVPNSINYYAKSVSGAQSYTLPPVAGNECKTVIIVNKSLMGDITIFSNAGGNDIWLLGASINTCTITPNYLCTFRNDGVTWTLIAN